MRRHPEVEPVNSKERRQLAALLAAFYLALLLEGVLRKWVVPQASNALVFIRDPIIVAILVAYWRFGPSPASRRVLGWAGLGVGGLVLCAGLQAMTSAQSWPALLAGIRNYGLFMPVCCAIRDAFTAEDYRRWLRWNCVIAAPVGLLVVLQYRASPAAVINAVPGGGNEGVFLVVEDVVRPYGLFSFSLGHSAYAAFMVCVALAVLAGGAGPRFGRATVVTGLGGIMVMGLLSGSRTYFLLAASVLATFLATAIVLGPARAKTTGLGVAFALLILGGAVAYCVPDVIAVMVERQTTAVAAEGSTVDRIVAVVTGFAEEAGEVPLFGYGLGSGTNIAAFLANGSTDHILAEYELTRIVQELGPIFGGFYLLLRWSFMIVLAVLTFRAAKRGNLQPACFLGFLVPVFLAHDITLQNTMIGIGWFSAGMLMSAERVGGDAAPRPTPARVAVLREAPA